MSRARAPMDPSVMDNDLAAQIAESILASPKVDFQTATANIPKVHLNGTSTKSVTKLLQEMKISDAGVSSNIQEGSIRITHMNPNIAAAAAAAAAELEEEMGHYEDDESCSLFIGDLARNVTEDVLKESFAKLGDVVFVDIKRDKVTHNNLGYGFVQFRTRQQAINAKNALNGVELGGRKIRLGWAQKNTTLFIGDLDGGVTSEELQNVFRQFGPLIEEDTFVKAGSGKYGFVRFVHRIDAERAKAEMHKKVVGTRAIRIGWGDNNTQKNCVYVQFNPTQGASLTEEEISAYFHGFGEIVSVSLPRFINSKLKGFAFVHFSDSDDGQTAAQSAIRSCAGQEIKIQGVPVKVSYGKKQLFNKNKRKKGTPSQPNSPRLSATTPPSSSSSLSSKSINNNNNNNSNNSNNYGNATNGTSNNNNSNNSSNNNSNRSTPVNHYPYPQFGSHVPMYSGYPYPHHLTGPSPVQPSSSSSSSSSNPSPVPSSSTTSSTARTLRKSSLSGGNNISRLPSTASYDSRSTTPIDGGRPPYHSYGYPFSPKARYINPSNHHNSHNNNHNNDSSDSNPPPLYGNYYMSLNHATGQWQPAIPLSPHHYPAGSPMTPVTGPSIPPSPLFTPVAAPIPTPHSVPPPSPFFSHHSGRGNVYMLQSPQQNFYPNAVYYTGQPFSDNFSLGSSNIPLSPMLSGSDNSNQNNNHSLPSFNTPGAFSNLPGGQPSPLIFSLTPMSPMSPQPPPFSLVSQLAPLQLSQPAQHPHSKHVYSLSSVSSSSQQQPSSSSNPSSQSQSSTSQSSSESNQSSRQ